MNWANFEFDDLDSPRLYTSKKGGVSFPYCYGITKFGFSGMMDLLNILKEAKDLDAAIADMAFQIGPTSIFEAAVSCRDQMKDPLLLKKAWSSEKAIASLKKGVSWYDIQCEVAETYLKLALDSI